MLEVGRRCTRDRNHAGIRGKYTRPSAVYCHGPAVALAHTFVEHLKEREVCQGRSRLKAAGRVDLATNDLCISYDGELVDSWRWQAGKVTHKHQRLQLMLG